MKSTTNWIVLKFGGTSVSTAKNWQNIVNVIRQYQNDARILVVCSAPAQTSNLLEKLIGDATQGGYETTLQKIENIFSNLATELNLDFNGILETHFAALKRLIHGVSLLKEASVRIEAQIMAYGEFLLTHLGFAYLNANGIDLIWQDARDYLVSEEDKTISDKQRYLAARCDSEPDLLLQQRFNALNKPVVITQGFFAINRYGETVLLGRGGSDTSAALFAAKISASRCEIWTDVPGIYTANPHQIPAARMLKALDYAEAQEIAAMGGKVLHPNCISPLKKQNIPLHIKYTPDPTNEGTVVTKEGKQIGVQIKSIMTKFNLSLITVETTRMWQQVGFLAEVFACFKKHHLSVDLISTAESCVTVSLDNSAKTNQPSAIHDLLDELNTFAQAKIIEPCASVSLIGHNIGAILHKLGDAFEVFESQKIYLLSQAANDLNLTFVVDEAQADRIAQKLHTLLIDYHPQSQYLSKTWQEQFGEIKENETPWWKLNSARLIKLVEQQSPLYVYDETTLQSNAKKIKTCTALDHVFYAIKANANKTILELFYQAQLNFECVSITEVEHILALFPQIDRERILFTPNFAAKVEYSKAFEYDIYVTLDNIYPLQHWPELFRNQKIILRVDPGEGAGHHKYVHTAGNESKFGISLNDLDMVNRLVKEHHVKVIGLHAHTGSGILQPDKWQTVALQLAKLSEQFNDVKIINIGGGLGIVERPGQKALDLNKFNESLLTVKAAYPHLQLWLEPGRYLVANAGVIVATVTQIKTKGDITFIGIDAGMNSLIRPALYGAYHEIVNLSRLDEPKSDMVNIVGPICESADILGYSRLVPKTTVGDVVLIANTGAYGYAMSSNYNLRKPAEERVLAEF